MGWLDILLVACIGPALYLLICLIAYFVPDDY